MGLSIYVANLEAVVQMKVQNEDDNGEWWQSVAAFKSNERAQDYARDERKSHPKRQYRVIGVGDLK